MHRNINLKLRDGCISRWPLGPYIFLVTVTSASLQSAAKFVANASNVCSVHFTKHTSV